MAEVLTATHIKERSEEILNARNNVPNKLQNCKAMQRLTQIWQSTPNCRLVDATLKEDVKKFSLAAQLSLNVSQEDIVSGLCRRYSGHLENAHSLASLLSQDIYDSINEFSLENETESEETIQV